MKKIKTLLLTGIFSCSLYAANSFYIGAGVMTGNGIETWNDNSDYDYSENFNSKAGSVKLGFITKSNNRFELSVNKFYLESDYWTDVYTGLDLNYLLVFFNGNFHPYVGLGIGGYISKNLETYDEETGEFKNATALAGNASLGFLYSIGKSLEFESALKYHHINWHFDDGDLVDDIMSIYLGANLKF